MRGSRTREHSRAQVRGARALAIAAFGLLASNRAAAWRDVSENPEFDGQDRVVWMRPAIPLAVDGTTFPGASLDDVEDAVARAAAAWSEPECTSLAFELRSSSGAPIVGDGITTITWVHSGWVDRGFPSDGVAATDISYGLPESSGRWEIVDADIYLNATDWGWAPTSGEPDSNVRSIEAVVAHELGHVIGLLHLCEHDDADAPSCDSIAGAEYATMYPLYTGPGQTSLDADDVAGVCAIYPAIACPECGDGEVCVLGECVPECEPACTDGFVCEGGECTPPSCESDDQCSGELRCEAGACVAGPGLFGDPCDEARDCALGACSLGACTAPCLESCPSGTNCDVQTDTCLPEKKTLGDSCHLGIECLSHLCLLNERLEGVCTRSCDDASASAMCPVGFACGVVSEQAVCMPAASTGPSCALAPPSPTHSRLGATALLLVAVPIAFRIASRQRRPR